MVRAGMATLVRRVGADHGQALAFICVLLAVILGSTAFAIDVGSYATDRRDLQNAADAIALAASQELPNQDAATAKAQAWATKNDIPLADMTLTFTAQNPPSQPNPKVKVSLQRNHTFHFAPVIGINNANVQASAAAIRTSPGGSTGLVPWSVTQPVLNLVPPGQTTVLKYDSTGGGNGNFGAVRIDGSGANVYRDTVEFGSNNGLCATGVTGCPFASVVSTETGNMVGPTRTAVDYLMANTATSCDAWAEVTLIAGGKTTLDPACNPFIAGGNPASLRIIVIPVIASLCGGNCNVTITQFALFFVEGYAAGGCSGNHCNIQGRFINSNTNYGAQVGVFGANTLAHFVRLVE